MVLAQRYRESNESESEKEEEVMSIDQLFDRADGKIIEEKEIKNEIRQEIEDFTSTSIKGIDYDEPEENKIPINNILSEEDIEALFEE